MAVSQLKEMCVSVVKSSHVILGMFRCLFSSNEHSFNNMAIIYYSAPNKGMEYCDEHVCLSVCPHLKNHILPVAKAQWSGGMVLFAFCARRQPARGLDESVKQWVLGAECAMHHCLVIDLCKQSTLGSL